MANIVIIIVKTDGSNILKIIKTMLNKLTEEQKSYIIGLFQGDASLKKLSRGRGKLKYEISIKDKNIIDKLYAILSPHVNVLISERIRDTNFKKNYHSICLTINNKNFRKQIEKYIPAGKKSSIISPPENAVFEHYIRGLIDADGSIGIDKNNICFLSICVNSEEIKDYIINHIYNVTGAVKRIKRNARDDIYNIKINNEDAQLFASKLYENATIYIDRKYNSYLSILAWKRSVPKAARKKKWLDEEDKVISNENADINKLCKQLDRTKKSIITRLWRLKCLK